MSADSQEALRRAAERVLAYLAADGPLGAIANSEGYFDLKPADLRRLARYALRKKS